MFILFNLDTLNDIHLFSILESEQGSELTVMNDNDKTSWHWHTFELRILKKKKKKKASQKLFEKCDKVQVKGMVTINRNSGSFYL